MLEAAFVSFFLYFGLTKEISKHIRDTAPLVKRYGKPRVLLVVRSVFLIVGVLSALTLLPDLQDAIALSRGEAPLMRVGIVAHKSGSALAGVFSQDIIFDEKYSRPDNTFHAEFFPSRYFVVGATYEIEFLPNSHIILKARLVETD
jgi:hypothetical protein